MSVMMGPKVRSEDRAILDPQSCSWVFPAFPGGGLTRHVRGHKLCSKSSPKLCKKSMTVHEVNYATHQLVEHATRCHLPCVGAAGRTVSRLAHHPTHRFHCSKHHPLPPQPLPPQPRPPQPRPFPTLHRRRCRPVCVHASSALRENREPRSEIGQAELSSIRAPDCR
jgi:hypothetical protein